MSQEKSNQDTLSIVQVILETSPLWEEIRDHQGRLVYVSPACERMSGYPGVEFVRNDQLFFDLLHVEDKHLWKTYHTEFPHHSASNDIGLRLWHQDGTLRWIVHQCHGSIALNESIWHRCSNYEITQLKQLEEKNHQLETILQTLKQFPEVSIVIYDLDGKITFTNQFFASLFGKEVDQLLGMNIWQLFPPEQAEFRKAVLQQALARGEMIRVEDHGVTGIYESIVFPLRDEKNAIARVAVISRNITEYKRAQEGLIRDQEELERRVQERTKQIRETNRRLRKEIAERMLIEKQLRAQINRAQALAIGAERLNQSLELADVFQAICEEAAQITPAMPYSSVLLYEEDRDAFVIVAAYPPPPIEPIEGIPPIARSQFERYQPEQNSPILLLLVNQEEPLHEVFCVHEGVKSLISVPMRYKGVTIGALILYATDETYQPSPEELSMLFALTQLASSAIANAQLYKETTTQYEKLQVLSQKLMHLQEQERAHLGRELHDEIGQSLTSLNLKLQLLIEQSATGRHNAHETHSELLKIYQTTQHMLSQIRELSLDLRPALLEDFGLIPALVTLFDRTREQLSLVIDFKHNGILDRRFPPLIEITVYRIIQEALTNIARHAGVGEAKVRLWADSNQISFQIEDQGRGFDKEKALSMASTSTGLVGIQERVKYCHGRLSIEAHPDEGTCITVELPLEEA